MNAEMLAALGGIDTVPFGQQGGAGGGGGQPAFAAHQPRNSTMLDLVFILDCTGSMGSYIASATKNIEVICENIVQSGHLPSADCLRIGLIGYRDYPPQDNSYVTKSFPFTSSVPTMKEQLKSLYASGGGDGPEAVTAGIRAALDLDWRSDAAKMCVLIADAPCHGIGEYGDGFPQGGPDGEDPLVLCRQMAAAGIPLSSPPPSSSPSPPPDLLSHVIVGSALEHLEMERLIQEVGNAVAERIHAGMQTVDDVARELHERLLLRGEETKQLKFESIHRETEESRHNVRVFVEAASLEAAKPQLQKIRGSRFTEKYLQSRYNSSFARSIPGASSVLYPTLPPRPGSHPSSTSSSLSTSPSSPPRRVISEFKPFAASSGLSVADAPLGLGNENQPSMSEDEVDKLAQSVELKFAGISLEQAKRITVASAWRTAPPRA
ncbi:hypothetical protein NBRC10513v2_007424 [Rhodotorula toruloides]